MQDKRQIFLYRRVKGGDEKLLRRINVHVKFKPDRDWMYSIEPQATHWGF